MSHVKITTSDNPNPAILFFSIGQLASHAALCPPPQPELALQRISIILK